MLVELQCVVAVVMDFFVADGDDKWHEELVMRDGEGHLVHVVVCEMCADKLLCSFFDVV